MNTEVNYGRPIQVRGKNGCWFLTDRNDLDDQLFGQFSVATKS